MPDALLEPRRRSKCLVNLESVFNGAMSLDILLAVYYFYTVHVRAQAMELEYPLQPPVVVPDAMAGDRARRRRPIVKGF